MPATAPALGSTEGGPLADERTVFDDVTSQAGFPDELGRTRVAWGDYDGDGWEDLLLDGRMLWRNDQDGTFTDVTAAAGLGSINSVGGVWADYDNDGDLDFYAIVRSKTARDALWRNDGDGTFTDATMQSGEIYDFLPSEGAAWGDYDNDGFVDLYVANYETASVDSEAELGIGTPDVLYRNIGNGRFENVTGFADVELDGQPLCGRGVVWADYDDDGDLDIYVSNYRLDPNLLWENLGDSFINVAASARAEGYASNNDIGGPRYGHTIGSDFGDYDNDGDMDLYASNLAHPRFIMFSDKSMLLQRGVGNAYVDRFYGSGIAYCETSSDPSWADYDNDGDLDLYFTAVYEECGSRLFRNTGRDRFEDATGESRTSVDNGWGTGWCDYDHDGDLDLAVGSGTAFRLLENGGNENHWLEVELEGTLANSLAIGARVRVVTDTASMVRDVKGGRGTTSQDMLACHFGLGDNTDDVEVAVRWPGDRSWTEIGPYSVDQRIHITQGEGDADLAISLRVEPEEPEEGEVVELTATIENVGSSRFDYFQIKFILDGHNEIEEWNFYSELYPGETVSIESLWQAGAEGDHTLSAQINDSLPLDTNPANDISSKTVSVRTKNLEPIARIMASPSEGPPGETITFDGSESIDDTGVSRYLFEFGDGTDSGWGIDLWVTHTYNIEGEFLASLTVEDLDGVRSSNFATTLIKISSMGYRPTAEIITILPNPARWGDIVTLHGTGYGIGGANITGHSWNSSMDGHLGDEALITTTRLSVGEHNIFFKVRDERGLWSDPVTTLLVVNPQEGEWTVNIDHPREGAVPGGDTLMVVGTASYTSAQVVTVEVRVDNEAWEVASGTVTWSYELDLTGLADGPHTIRVRASSMDSTSENTMVNFTLGEVQTTASFDVWEWLTTWQGMVFVIAVLALIVANIYASRRRRRRSMTA